MTSEADKKKEWVAVLYRPSNVTPPSFREINVCEPESVESWMDRLYGARFSQVPTRYLADAGDYFRGKLAEQLLADVPDDVRSWQIQQLTNYVILGAAALGRIMLDVHAHRRGS